MNHSSFKQSRAEQLSEQLRQHIQEKVWPVGTKVPAIRQIAQQYNVSSRTAHLALRELEDTGWIQRNANSQAFVCAPKHVGPFNPVENVLKNVTLPHIGLIGAYPLSLDPDRWEVHILHAVEIGLTQAGGFYLTRIFPPGFNTPQFDRNMLKQVEQIAPHLSGAIVFQLESKVVLQIIRILDELNVPWVSTSRLHPQILHNFVSADNVTMGRMAGRCFVLNNFEKVVILSTDVVKKQGSSARKALGVIQAYLEENRSLGGIDYVRTPSAKWQAGRAAIKEYLQTHQAPQAIFATGDYLALGAMAALQEEGIRVPQNVSVIGSTGLEAAERGNPPLAVVTQPMEEMGHTAAQMLLEMLRTGARRLPGRHLMGRLEARQSLALSPFARTELVREGILVEPLEEELVLAG